MSDWNWRAYFEDRISTGCRVVGVYKNKVNLLVVCQGSKGDFYSYTTNLKGYCPSLVKSLVPKQKPKAPVYRDMAFEEFPDLFWAHMRNGHRLLLCKVLTEIRRCQRVPLSNSLRQSIFVAFKFR